MNPIRRRRLIFALLLLCAVGAATAVVLTALNENLQHFFSPSDVVDGKAPDGRRFRLGGVVLEGSVERSKDGLGASFVVTDRFRETKVDYRGILPDLFREGQSVVATGTLGADGRFAATEVLAKHDENYMPKEVAEAIARAKQREAASK